MAMSMPRIISCSVNECAYNKNNQCHTLAITVGNGHPSCDTFVKARSKGGSEELRGGVGACKEASCSFNRSLECSAQGISVAPHSGHGDCVTFKAR
ncbi:MAG TPA: DUF1540 domain-containing protein [Thermodesulfobacteriota bacterium]|nr:DUF1540 domain-containing protein [Thermodesulfobacteriota bacterium]